MVRLDSATSDGDLQTSCAHDQMRFKKEYLFYVTLSESAKPIIRIANNVGGRAKRRR